MNIGFTFSTNDFRYGVVDGNKSSPILIDKNRIVYPRSMTIRQHSGWFETQINLLLDNYSPDNVAYKLPLTLSAIRPIQNSLFP